MTNPWGIDAETEKVLRAIADELAARRILDAAMAFLKEVETDAADRSIKD